MFHLTPEKKLQKAHITLMRHPETCLYSGVILMGETMVDDSVPTALTDGINKRYGRKFIEDMEMPKVTGLVLHENLHVVLKHLIRYRKLAMEDPVVANAAMDYVVNDIIMQLKDKEFCQLPEGGLWDIKFRDWSVLEVYDFLKTGREKPQPKQPGQQGQGQPKPGDGQGKGQGQPQKPQRGKDSRGREKVSIAGKDYGLEGTDEHDASGLEDPNKTEAEKLADMKAMSEAINEALHQGSLLAGRFGAKVPRVLKDSLVKPVDWKAIMAEFVTASVRGRSEYTYAKFNRRRLADDFYLPSIEDETVGEVICGIDTSGSIGADILSAFAKHLSDVCLNVQPERVRVLWWDTHVHGEQVFEPNSYGNIAKLLKPMGGGGTRAGCVSQYIIERRINADCILMLTDGYVEPTVDWRVRAPTLWLVTGRKGWQPPAGKLVRVE